VLPDGALAAPSGTRDLLVAVPLEEQQGDIALGLMPGKLGRAARVGGAVATLAVAGIAFKVGHSGGELVYRYNAASAYTTSGGAAADGAASRPDGAGEKTGEKGESAEREERR
jgi:hypothetical protein